MAASWHDKNQFGSTCHKMMCNTSIMGFWWLQNPFLVLLLFSFQSFNHDFYNFIKYMKCKSATLDKRKLPFTQCLLFGVCDTPPPLCSIYINPRWPPADAMKNMFNWSHSIMFKTSQICFWGGTTHFQCHVSNSEHRERTNDVKRPVFNRFHISRLRKITYIFQYPCNL